MWVLDRTNGVANIQQVDLVSGKVTEIVPVSANADSLSQSSSGILGVGIGTGTAGALELRNGTSGALIATVPVGASVKDVFAGADGSTFYVLNGNASSSSVTLVNTTTHQPSVSVPVPLDTIAIAVDPSGANLFALQAAGTVDQITIGTGQVAGIFTVGRHPVAVAVAPQGGTIYVLKHAGPSVMNVGVIDVNTERQLRVIPAPSNAVDIQLGLDGRSIYDLVGTTSYGNIQVFPLPG